MQNPNKKINAIVTMGDHFEKYLKDVKPSTVLVPMFWRERFPEEKIKEFVENPEATVRYV